MTELAHPWSRQKEVHITEKNVFFFLQEKPHLTIPFLQVGDGSSSSTSHREQRRMRLKKVNHVLDKKMENISSKARQLGADSLKASTRSSKKYMVLYQGKWIHFGAKGYSDFTIHKDAARRVNYRSRHASIRLADGRPAYTVKSSPAYWAWHLLW